MNASSPPLLLPKAPDRDHFLFSPLFPDASTGVGLLLRATDPFCQRDPFTLFPAFPSTGDYHPFCLDLRWHTQPHGPAVPPKCLQAVTPHPLSIELGYSSLTTGLAITIRQPHRAFPTLMGFFAPPPPFTSQARGTVAASLPPLSALILNLFSARPFPSRIVPNKFFSHFLSFLIELTASRIFFYIQPQGTRA